ncbi:MAG TPA: AAA family ATPase [Legionellaceae bacterium]|nr:AAA family ATPase [Legionellaceae bacterium]
MNIVFLYGPPAAGKLTIAQELQKRLGYKLLHNHMLIQLFDNLFDFHDPIRRELTREFRLRIVEEAVKENSDLIITSGSAGSRTIFPYYTQLIEVVEKLGGHIALVQVIADSKILVERVDNQSRKDHGKAFGKTEMRRIIDEYPYIFDKYPERKHLTIDTTHVNPQQAAAEIITYYHL